VSVTLTIIEALFTSGSTLYAVIRNRLTGQVWNNSTPGFEVFNSAHWSQYAIALTEQSPTGYYTATRPAGLAGALVSESIYQQGGGSPATSDSPATNLAYSAGDNVAAVSGDPAIAPSNLQAALSTEAQGTVASGTISASSFPTSLTDTLLNLYQGRILLMTSGAAYKSAAVIAGYNPTNGVITLLGGLAAAPSPGDSFVIV
jgi:hypothetical protein